MCVEALCALVNRIAALRDSQGHDLRRRVGDPSYERLWIGGCQDVVDDAADHLDASFVLASYDEAVQAVLSLENLGHPGIGRHHPAPNDRPIPVPHGSQFVGIGGEVSTVKSTDSDVDDPGAERPALVAGNLDSEVEPAERGVSERNGRHDSRSSKLQHLVGTQAQARCVGGTHWLGPG